MAKLGDPDAGCSLGPGSPPPGDARTLSPGFGSARQKSAGAVGASRAEGPARARPGGGGGRGPRCRATERGLPPPVAGLDHPPLCPRKAGGDPRRGGGGADFPAT